MPPLNKPNEVWMPFPDKAVEGGFTGRTPAHVNSFELSQNIEDLAERELAYLAGRKRIETALSTSVNHDATAARLDEFR